MEINIVRCILILLVILIHLTPFKESYPNAQNAILAFVVPLFLFITGYLFNVNKTGKQFAFYLRSLLIMYVIFETTYVILSYFFPVKDCVNELNISSILEKLFLSPIGPYWYLYTMIICGSIYYTIHRACNFLNINCAISLSVFVCIVLSYCSPILGLMSPLAYFAGVIFKKYLTTPCRPIAGSPVAILIVIVTLFYGVIFNPGYATQLSYFSIVVGVCIIGSLTWCAKWIPTKVCRTICFVGANTLPIYLFHPMFTLMSKFILKGLISQGNLLCFCFLTITSAAIGTLIIGYVLDVTGVSMLLFKKRMIRNFEYILPD